MTSTATKNSITLKGSAQIIKEYLNYGINSIIFQRGIYPAESFSSVQKYGITLLMSKDEKIISFISNVLKQAEEWLANNEIEKISMIITNVHNKEVLECWEFKVQSEPGNVNGENVDPNNPTSSKELKKIQNEIRDVMRQISATVSFLPLLESICSFDILIHTNENLAVPDEWNETDSVVIKNSQSVALKAFSTGLHKLETVVNYKMAD